MNDALDDGSKSWQGEGAARSEAAMPIDLTERRWIQEAARGDAAAFERLYRRHVPRVYALCLRLLGGRHDRAEDATQDTFVAAWRGLPGFAGQSLFSTWLHRIAVHCALQSQRPSFRRYEVSEAEVPDLNERAIPENVPALDVEAAIAALPDGARHVLVLVALHGHTHEEAADFLGIAEGTSKAQLNRARRLLIDRLSLGENS
jgi:RNA polymerase sigma-70 factor (ECF subfamily)